MGNNELRYGSWEYDLASRFQHLRERVKKLWQGYHEGSIRYDALIKELKSCNEYDDYLVIWTMGHDDHLWYKFNKATGEWQQGPPPVALETLDEVSRMPPHIAPIIDKGIWFPPSIRTEAEAPDKKPENYPAPDPRNERKARKRRVKQALQAAKEARKRVENNLEQFLRHQYPDSQNERKNREHEAKQPIEAATEKIKRIKDRLLQLLRR